MMASFILLVTYLCCAFSVSSGAPLTAEAIVQELNKINATELLLGPNISDDLKAQMINCINDEIGNPSNCPSENIPMTDSLQKLLSLTKVPETNIPVKPQTGLLGGLMTGVENIKKTIISNPLTNIMEALKTEIEQAPTKVTELQATLSGGKKDAETLIAFAEQITSANHTADPKDPFRDISQYLTDKANKKDDTAGFETNKARLIELFANNDIASLRRYAANYNILVPDVLLIGFLRSTVHL